MAFNIPFPDDVRAFMEQNIDGIEQLEVLRILSENEDKRWDVASLMAEVQAPSQALLGYLGTLQSRGLISSVQREEGTLWQYGSSSEEMRTMLSRLLQTYKERPVTMIRMVYAKKAKSLEAFSDAFRLRKES